MKPRFPKHCVNVSEQSHWLLEAKQPRRAEIFTKPDTKSENRPRHENSRKKILLPEWICKALLADDKILQPLHKGEVCLPKIRFNLVKCAPAVVAVDTPPIDQPNPLSPRTKLCVRYTQTSLTPPHLWYFVYRTSSHFYGLSNRTIIKRVTKQGLFYKLT